MGLTVERDVLCVGLFVEDTPFLNSCREFLGGGLMDAEPGGTSLEQISTDG